MCFVVGTVVDPCHIDNITILAYHCESGLGWELNPRPSSPSRKGCFKAAKLIVLKDFF